MFEYHVHFVRFEWQSMQAPAASSSRPRTVPVDRACHGRVRVVAAVRDDLCDDEERGERNGAADQPLLHAPILAASPTAGIRRRPDRAGGELRSAATPPFAARPNRVRRAATRSPGDARDDGPLASAASSAGTESAQSRHTPVTRSSIA